jgi:hypothetical protein
MSPSADHVAVALIAAFKAGQNSARLLLSARFDEPPVVLLADAAVVLAKRFSLRNADAARLCAIRRPEKMVTVKMSPSHQTVARWARQSRIAEALDARFGAADDFEARLGRMKSWAPKKKESGTALVNAPLHAKPCFDDECADRSVKGRSEAASAEPISPLDRPDRTNRIAEMPLVGAGHTKASPDKAAETSARNVPDWMVPRSPQRGDPSAERPAKPAKPSPPQRLPADLQPRALSADLRAQIDAKIAAGQVTVLPTGHAAGISGLEMALGRVAAPPIPEGGGWNRNYRPAQASKAVQA